ncbi:hypothetical protein B1T45_03155 [Mycobacterium kansasii]|nr:hypothetical protein B1T45_03155 [Mycobacterium kansasii]ARG77207.1 hypothetical protein B1T51_25135 [Mycobacterium kansasii]ARG94825.1 hypothetical protein B1T50_25990 [Mycobacterium kansasii]ETZ99939.1 hypothetical protein I547_5191 [Mycobacterium kansasii 824]KZS77697.1 hypothetical protein A4G30_24435 [Mycobacterium kansasii]
MARQAVSTDAAVGAIASVLGRASPTRTAGPQPAWPISKHTTSQPPLIRHSLAWDAMPKVLTSISIS